MTKEQRAEYTKEYRRKNPEKVKQWHLNYIKKQYEKLVQSQKQEE